MTPFISIIIPFLNRIDLLLETIRSFQSQTYNHWELLLIDDGTDIHEREKLEVYCSCDSRIKLFQRVKGKPGASACRNIGLRYAQGDWVLFFDSDDLVTPHCLSLRIHECEKHDKLDMLVFQTAIFKQTPSDANRLWNRFTEQDDLLRFLNSDVVWPICGSVIRKSFIQKFNLQFNENAKSYQDWEWHVYVLSRHPMYKKIASPVNMFVRRNDNYLKNSDSHHAIDVVLNRLENMKRLSCFEPIQNNALYLETLQNTMFFEIFRLQNKHYPASKELIDTVFDIHPSESISSTAQYLLKRSKALAVHPILFKMYNRFTQSDTALKKLIGERHYNAEMLKHEKSLIEI